MELSEQEAHCIARLLQSALHAGDEGIMTGCSYCKYNCGSRLPMFYTIKRRLTEETGVDVQGQFGGTMPTDNFPHLTFLKNSNQKIQEYYQTICSNILKIFPPKSGNADT